MEDNLAGWKTQIRKGYIELCLMALFDKNDRLYGFQILELMVGRGLALKEGTLYPILSRMTSELVLSASWETEGNKGHPRKYYSLTKKGRKIFEEMKKEYQDMHEVFEKMKHKVMEESHERKQEA